VLTFWIELVITSFINTRTGVLMAPIVYAHHLLISSVHLRGLVDLLWLCSLKSTLHRDRNKSVTVFDVAVYKMIKKVKWLK
jgi:hypothetical protein